MTVLTSTGQEFYRLSLKWNCSDAFHMVRLKLWVFESVIAEVKCCLHHSISKVRTANLICDSWCSLWPRGWSCVYQFPHCKLLFVSLFHTVLLERKSLCSAQSGGGSYAPVPLVGSVYMHYLKFFCSGNLSLSYVHNHVLISIWNCKYLVFTLHYNPIQVNFVAQIIPALAIGGCLFWLLGPFDVLPRGYVWFSFFFFLTYYFCLALACFLALIRCSRLLLQIFWPSTGINYFFKEPWCLLLKNVIRNQDMSYFDTKMSFHSFLSWQSKEILVCTVVHVCALQQISRCSHWIAIWWCCSLQKTPKGRSETGISMAITTLPHCVGLLWVKLYPNPNPSECDCV